MCKKHTVQLNVDEGWYSAEELAEVLKWPESLCYINIVTERSGSAITDKP